MMRVVLSPAFKTHSVVILTGCGDLQPEDEVALYRRLETLCQPESTASTSGSTAGAAAEAAAIEAIAKGSTATVVSAQKKKVEHQYQRLGRTVADGRWNLRGAHPSGAPEVSLLGSGEVQGHFG